VLTIQNRGLNVAQAVHVPVTQGKSVFAAETVFTAGIRVAPVRVAFQPPRRPTGRCAFAGAANTVATAAVRISTPS
jgi:hypothetical protein